MNKGSRDTAEAFGIKDFTIFNNVFKPQTL